MEKNVCIVNYNTTELTIVAIKSLMRHTPDCKITVFDNSDKRPFCGMDGVRIIDNTDGSIIDFEPIIDSFPDKELTTNNWGSAKHTMTIQKLFEYFPDGFLLMDSDVIVLKDVLEFFDKDVAWSGNTGVGLGLKQFRRKRVLPYICYINVRLCNNNGIRYFDPNRSWRLNTKDLSKCYYDTGASFFEDCSNKNLPYKLLDINDYILHFNGGSYKHDKSYVQWLDKYRYLYDDMKQNDNAKEQDKYLVVIPFFAGGAQGRELEYSIAGWRRHFKEPYTIVVVGDHHPVVDTGDDIVFIECERVPEQKPENYRPHIDFVKKFKAVRKRFPDSKGFIFVADDCYAVNDFDINDVKVLRQNSERLKVGSLTSAWERDKKKTVELLQKEGYPIRNFTTHIPAWIEWDKLEALWERFDMEHNSYIFEDLYFNIYYPTRIPLTLHIDHDNYKCGVYRPNPRMNYIYDAFKKKIWIQNSVEGWIPALDKILSNYYGI